MIHPLLGRDSLTTDVISERLIPSSSTDSRGSPDEKSSFCIAHKKQNLTLNDLLVVIKSERGSASGPPGSLTHVQPILALKTISLF